MRARAARLIGFGQPLSVEEIDLPEPGEGEAVVEMSFAAVNPVDRYQVLGRVAADAPLPRTLGSEGAGVVRTAGPYEGRRVFVNRSSVVRPSDGTWATHVLVARDKVIEVPEAVGLDVAAATGVAGVTALRCVTELGAVTADDQVLVLGASGGVGSVIVGLAHRLGAYVVAQTGSEEKVSFVAERGADRVVVAEAAQLAAELGSWQPSVVFDPLGDGFTGAAMEALSPRGRLVIFGTSADPNGTLPLQVLYRKGLKVLGYAGLLESAERTAEGVRLCFDALRDDRMEIVIESVLPLGEVNVSLDRFASREVQGKQVLDLRA
ncbi:MAG: quinone oxidoreductase family protein [Acidimicrobiales bacterium]